MDTGSPAVRKTPDRRRSPGLFARTLLAFLASLAFLLALLVGIFLLGMRYSIRDWDARKGENIQAVVLPLIRETYRKEGRLDKAAIAAAVAPHLSPSVYVLVFDRTGALVFGYRQGQTLEEGEGSGAISSQGAGQGRGGLGIGQGEAGSGSGRYFLQRHPEAMPVDLTFEGTSIGTYAAGILGFADDTENRQFLSTLTLIGGAGAAASFLLAVAIAFLFSSRLSSHSVALAAGLSRLAEGDRGVTFPQRGARELVQIGRSASALQSQLAKEEELRAQWASDVSHDLRTPLTAVKSQIEAMIDGVLQPTPDRLRRAFSELGRIEDLVNNLGELSRIESPGMVLAPKDLPAEGFLADLCHRFTLEADKRGIQFSCESEIASLYADEHLLMRATTNVVQNAFQHTADGGKVSVRIAAEPEGGAPSTASGSASGLWMAVRVENTGRIPEGEIPKVFDRLYRGEHSRHTKGSGLGLTISRAIVELHGGGIRIGNTTQGTTEVVIRLPAPISTQSS